MLKSFLIRSAVMAVGMLSLLGVAQADGHRTLRIAVADDVATMDPTFGQSGATNLFLKKHLQIF